MRKITFFLSLTIIVSAASAMDITTPGTIASPTALTNGTYTLTGDAMTTYDAATKSGSGTTFGWSINSGSGGWKEGGLYYAISVPAYSTVTLNGTFSDSSMDATGAFWSEVTLYKANDLSESVVLDGGKSLLTEAGYSAAVTAGGGTTQGMWDNGHGYFMYGTAANDVADALFAYPGNAENLAANSDLGVGGQPVAVIADYTDPQSTIPTDFNDRPYTWDIGLQRPMKDSMLATASNSLAANDTTTEYIIFLKGGSQNGLSSMEYSNVTLTIVPEPATMSLLAIGAAAMLIRRHKK